MDLRKYIDVNYSVPVGMRVPGCDPTRGALRRFANHAGVDYQTVQRWVKSGAVVKSKHVIVTKVLCVLD